MIIEGQSAFFLWNKNKFEVRLNILLKAAVLHNLSRHLNMELQLPDSKDNHL